MLRSRNMRTHKNCKGAEATDISVSFTLWIRIYRMYSLYLSTLDKYMYIEVITR